MDGTTEDRDLKARQAAAIAAQTKNSPEDTDETPTQGDSASTAPSAEDAAEPQSAEGATAQGGAQSAPSAQDDQGDAQADETAGTQAAGGDAPSGAPQAQTEKMVPQSQVDKLVGKARQEGRESAMKALYDKYGVEDPNALDELFGNGQRYDGLNEQLSEQSNSLKGLQSENALLKSRIDPSRWDDVKARLAFDHLDVTPENIQNELATHPEWLGQQGQNPGLPAPTPLTPEMGEQAVQNSSQRAQALPKPSPTTITKLGAEPGTTAPETDEEAKAMHLYGLDK